MPWLYLKASRFIRAMWPAGTRSAVALVFAIAALPMALIVGLAVDFSFYIQARSQLNLAADAAAMHAVRVASATYSATTDKTITAPSVLAGQTAGQQWFAAQLGTLSNANVTPVVTVTFNASPPGFSSRVVYNGTISTYFGALFATPNLAISNLATAVITSSYIEILMLLDNSSSMLIGDSLADIIALETVTPCSAAGMVEGQGMSVYSWNYGNNAQGKPYGYTSGVQPPTTVTGSCDSRYTGSTTAPTACFYVPALPTINPANTLKCSMTSKNPGGTPASPCAFACHDRLDGLDYYALARAQTNPVIKLRLDSVQAAAAGVVNTMNTAGKEQFNNQFSVGIYQFNNSVQKVYPPGTLNTLPIVEAGNDLQTAYNIASNLQNTPFYYPGDLGNTYFGTSMATLAANVTPAGDGSTPTGALKNLFIVTDGMENEASTIYGPMTSVSNETTCAKFWNMGFNVYVLYTPYLPLPNTWAFANTTQYSEPTSSSVDVAALKACARYPGNFFTAGDQNAINNAMQAMLAAALNSPGRVSN